MATSSRWRPGRRRRSWRRASARGRDATRRGTILVLLGAILLFAVFGWQAFGWIALSVLAFFLLALGIVAVALWRLKVRVRRKMQEVARDLEARLRAAGATVPPDRQDLRRDAIDVQGVVRRPRDGADDPDRMETER